RHPFVRSGRTIPSPRPVLCREPGAAAVKSRMPQVVAAAAQRTSRIRLGAAVTLLPLHNPTKIAEEAATANILSEGRFEFGVGRGVAYQYPCYGVPLEKSRERFEEALDFVVQAWTNEPFSFKGDRPVLRSGPNDGIIDGVKLAFRVRFLG